MFYGRDYSFWTMINYWILVTLVFAVSLHLSLRVTRIELKLSDELYIIVISALVALTPLIGPYLAFIPAVFLTNRITDKGLGHVIGGMTLTWLIAFIAILLGIVLFRGLLAIGIFKT